jgi:hypothetical protein
MIELSGQGSAHGSPCALSTFKASSERRTGGGLEPEQGARTLMNRGLADMVTYRELKSSSLQSPAIYARRSLYRVDPLVP